MQTLRDTNSRGEGVNRACGAGGADGRLYRSDLVIEHSQDVAHSTTFTGHLTDGDFNVCEDTALSSRGNEVEQRLSASIPVAADAIKNQGNRRAVV